MIDLYSWTTPNGRKVSILLEELGIPYEAHAIDLSAGDQKSPEFLAVSPKGRIPMLRDRESGLVMGESGAIMLWLAEREGRFLGAPGDRPNMLEWLMWQMASQGPTLGRIHQFAHYGRRIGDVAEAQLRAQGDKVYSELNDRLSDREFVAGAEGGVYTIADMAIWPWVSRFEWHEVDLNRFPAVRDWYVRLAGRDEVQRGYHQPRWVNDVPMP